MEIDTGCCLKRVAEITPVEPDLGSTSEGMSMSRQMYVAPPGPQMRSRTGFSSHLLAVLPGSEQECSWSSK